MEARKERKDAEKRCRERKRKDKEAREKENREWAKKGKSPLPPPKTIPELDSSPSALGNVDYMMLDDPNAEGTGGQSPGQRLACMEPPAQAEGEGAHVRSSDERSPAWSDAGTLEWASPPGHQTSLGAASGGRSAGAGGSARSPRSGSKKRKLITVSG